jgi:hypothetical protein
MSSGMQDFIGLKKVLLRLEKPILVQSKMIDKQ